MNLNSRRISGLWGGIGGHMKINGFRRGMSNWVCDFELDGRHRVAYYNRGTDKWMFAHMERIDVATRMEMDFEMTKKLRQFLKIARIGSDIETTANNGQNQGDKNEKK